MPLVVVREQVEREPVPQPDLVLLSFGIKRKTLDLMKRNLARLGWMVLGFVVFTFLIACVLGLCTK